MIGVTYANRMPLMYHDNDRIEMDSGPVAPHSPNSPEGHRISIASVDPRFFDVIGAPVIRGRSLTSADVEQDTRAMVVNEILRGARDGRSQPDRPAVPFHLRRRQSSARGRETSTVVSDRRRRSQSGD